MSERAIAEKNLVVEEFKEKISRAKVLLLAQHSGFSVKETTELRKKLRAEDSEFRIVKNTLLERAFSGAGFAQLKDYFKGPTAVLLGYKDAVAPLKVLVKFAKDNGKGELRIGVVEGSVFSSKDLTEIAKLPPREILVAKVIGGFQAPIYGIVNVLQGTIRKLVYALSAIKDKKGGE